MLMRAGMGFAFLLSGCVYDYSTFSGPVGGAGNVGGVGNGTGEGGGGMAQGGQVMGGGPSGGDGGGGLGGDGGTVSIPLCEAAGLVACFEFEGDCKDSTGNGHDCNVAVNPGYGAGVEMLALSHNLVTNVGIPGGTGLVTTQVTLEAWVFPRDLPEGDERYGIIDNNEAWSIFIYPEGVRCEMTGGAQSLFSDPLVLDAWTHIGCVNDGSDITLYVDGIEFDTTSTTGLSNVVATEVKIGSDSPTGAPLVGNLDNLRIFSTARTAAQMCAAAFPFCAVD